MKNFIYKFKKATNFGKLYLLPKIHKRLHYVPVRTVISNCGSPTEKCSEFLGHHLKPLKNLKTAVFESLKFADVLVIRLNDLNYVVIGLTKGL